MNELKYKICIISASFHPELSPRAYRTTELAKELTVQGHDVTVIVPFNGIEYSYFSEKFGVNMMDMGVLKWKDIEIKGGTVRTFVRRGLRRFLNMLIEWPDIELVGKVNKALGSDNQFDFVISIAVPYPIHWGVALAKSKRSLSFFWIADCGDPYMGDTTDSFRKIFYFKYVEKWFCRKTDYLTVPFEGAISAYYPEFRNKIRIIPQGFSFTDLVIPKYNKSSSFTQFAYAGGFIPGKRDPRAMLEFLTSVQSDFRFIIYTSQQELLNEAKQTLDERLQIRPYIPRNELLTILAGMDFLVNFDNNVTTQLPSKLIDYAITGRPVLNIRDKSDFTTLVRFLEGDYSDRMLLEPAASYDIRNVARSFVNLYTENL